jgi:hypothetical protein
MAAVKLTEELKRAIVAMPSPEKDKLLLKLVAKDDMLVAKLHHQLLEDEGDVETRRDALRLEIDRIGTYDMETPGWLMMALRDFSGAIGRHVKVTKDKHGEVSLTVAMVNQSFRSSREMLEKRQGRADNFAEYVVKKAAFALDKLAKIHEDYYIEFEDEVNEMLAYLHGYPPTAKLAWEQGVPKKWNQ